MNMTVILAIIVTIMVIVGIVIAVQMSNKSEKFTLVPQSMSSVVDNPEELYELKTPSTDYVFFKPE